MIYSEFNRLCDSMLATSYVVQWGDCHVWKVGDKVFAIGGWEKIQRPAFTFKVSSLNFDLLSDEPGFRPAPYFASRGMKWIQLYDDQRQTTEQIEYYLKASHHIVSLGMSKKKQRLLGLNPVS